MPSPPSSPPPPLLQTPSSNTNCTAAEARDSRLRTLYRTAMHLDSPTPTPVDTDRLRHHLLLDGLPSDANNLPTHHFGRCSLRGLLWKSFLRVGRIDADEYARLVQHGPSIDDSRVREDARRTFAKSDDFLTRVPTPKIIRLLNAYIVWRGDRRGIYAQSMSLLAAPFLYVMPEPDAFHCFRAFLDTRVTAYVRHYTGARLACRLLDACVQTTLPKLHTALSLHALYAEVYAFPVMSSLGMCVRPLCDTVRLWDVVLAFGIHMHIVFTLARLALRSEALTAHAARTGTAPLSTRQLEQGFDLDADTVLAKGVALTAQLDQNLYAKLLAHSAAAASTNPDADTDVANTDGGGGAPDATAITPARNVFTLSTGNDIALTNKEVPQHAASTSPTKLQTTTLEAEPASPPPLMRRTTPTRTERHGVRTTFSDVEREGSVRPP